MRNIQYLSPTSISSFLKDQTEFYLSYLADRRPPKIPQTRPMSIGSSFDAYAKSHLHSAIFGKGNDPKFDFTAIFEAQVEPQNRDWAIGAGRYAFDCYMRSGALSDLMLELQGCIGEPRFEIEVRGVIHGEREGVTRGLGAVTFLGKPDIHFLSKQNAHITFDWKVNGFCGNGTTSPMQGYVRLRDETGINAGCHKQAQIMAHCGIMINAGGYLEHYNEDWARQLTIYSWLCGNEIGEDFIAAIDQLACGPKQQSGNPKIRVAEHRLRISRDFQWRVFSEAQKIWEIVHSDHIFRDISKEESAARCKLLDGTAEALEGEGSAEDKWFASVTREHRPF